jgi:phosphoribosylpyrophosphate synthetase
VYQIHAFIDQCHGSEIEDVVVTDTVYLVVTDAAWQLNVVAMEGMIVEGLKEIVLENEKACEFFI